MDAGMDANDGRQILLRVNLIRIATRCSSHGCPAVFRGSQQVPQTIDEHLHIIRYGLC